MGTIFIGFDGFVDHLYYAVAKRMNREAYQPFTTLKEFGRRIEEASSKSCNIESVLLHSNLGGNAPLLALGLSSFEFPLSLVGCLGFPTLHPLFQPLKKKSVELYSIGEPGITLAYEFQDGKLLLGTMNDVMKLSWEEALVRFPKFMKILEQSSFLVTVNWTMSPLVQEFWLFLLKQPAEMLQEKNLFIDFADPRKRSKEDLRQALAILSDLSKRMNCSIGVNLAETDALLSAFDSPLPSRLEEKAAILSEKMPCTSFYIHSPYEVIGIAARDQASWHTERLQVPHTDTPFRLTGAGDMFNAGVIAALYEKKTLQKQLLRGMATSGIWIRKGKPATKNEIHTFESLYSQSFEAIEEEFPTSSASS